MNPATRNALFVRAARTAVLASAIFGSLAAIAQPTPLQPPANGPRDLDPSWHALTNATVHVSPAITLKNATVVLRNGRITSVTPAPDGSTDAPAPPPGARAWDCTGLHVYAGFIDAYVDVDAPAPDPSARGSHWNPLVTPQRSVLLSAPIDESTASSLRNLGFTAAAVSPRGGIFRGTGALVSTAKPADDLNLPRPPVHLPRTFQAVGFETGSYPNSPLGSIAVIRQTLYDAEYNLQHPSSPNALDALVLSRALPEDAAPRDHTTFLFDAPDELYVLRAFKLMREFDIPAVILASGYEFRRLDAIRDDIVPRMEPMPAVPPENLGSFAPPPSTRAAAIVPAPAFILPLNFPEKPQIKSVADHESQDLRTLMTWEQAPTNPRRLDEAGITVALTTSKASRAGGRRGGGGPGAGAPAPSDRSRFLANLRTAIKHGLPEQRALAMLTTNPAAILSAESLMATVEPGKLANLIVADGPIFNEKTKIRDLWVDGIRHELNPPPDQQLEGVWTVTLNPPIPDPIEFHFDSKNVLTIRSNDKKARTKDFSLTGNRLSFTFDHAPFGEPGIFTNSALIQLAPPHDNPAAPPIPQTLRGNGIRSDGRTFTFLATRTSTTLPKEPKPDPAKPAGAPAADDPPPQDPNEPALGTWTCNITGGEPLPPDGMPATIILEHTGSDITGDFKSPLFNTTFSATFDPQTSALVFNLITPDSTPARFNTTIENNALTGTITSEAFTGSITGTRTPPTPPEESPTPDNAPAAQPADKPAGTPADKPKDPDANDDTPTDIPETFGYPFGPFAYDTPPPQPDAVVFHNATVWTSGPSGILKNAAVVVHRGIIKHVGPAPASGSLETLARQGNADPAFTFVSIDLAGKHLTPGLIDCHSHTGVSGQVNESGQAVTAEVRIGDLTNPDAVNWYRQLAGGITTVNSLHGSANPIGGQNQINKLRWGSLHPDDMHFNQAPQGIKFALGENVKRSNSSAGNNTRYPSTRMGVEAIIRERFTAAREYADAHADYNRQVARILTLRLAPHEQRRQIAALPRPVRRDLELDALAEILDGSRLVHCHSYRQDEILMLCRVAHDFNFRIGTFQHVLEGYKVAEAIKEHAIGGSAFSDWWAYKVEVQDAIPYAGSIMHAVGVCTSFNSDSDELARRMNTEAAKAVRYGNVAPADALKFVTINPAIQLGIDAFVGSIEPGKHADLAVWSGDPLSTLSRCESTWIDGREYFSLARDADLRAQNHATRQRIIQKILGPAKKPAADAPSTGENTDAPSDRPRRRPPSADLASFDPDSPDIYPIEDLAARAASSGLHITALRAQDAIREYHLQLLRLGIDPASARCGVCGVHGEHLNH